MNGAQQSVPAGGQTTESLASWRGSLSFIAEASDLLAGTLDEEHVRLLIAQLVVPRLAVWCAVYAAGETPAEPVEAAPRCAWHTDEEQADTLRERLCRLGPPPVPTGPEPWAGFGTGPGAEQAYVVGLRARGRSVGVVVIGGDRFPPGALEMAEELGRRAALAIDNARLYAAQTAMSRALQRSLLPPELPEIPNVEVAVVFEPAGVGTEVGGDFYDLFVAPPRAGEPCWRFAIGDVCGTGPEAAAVTGLARHALRILAAEDLPVPDVLTRLNRLILQEGTRSRLLTLVHGELCADAGGGVRLGLVCAGHPPPLLLRPDGTVTEVGTPQLLLGAFDEVEYGWDLVGLEPGDVLLCVTDGVTERGDGDGRLLGDDHGLERLLADCGGLSAGAVAAKIQKAVRDYGATPSHDDVALTVFRVTSSGHSGLRWGRGT